MEKTVKKTAEKTEPTKINTANVPNFNPDRRKLPPTVKPVSDSLPAALKNLLLVRHFKKGNWGC